jgi:transcriptional regulator with XRE-family HTH domain
MSRSFKNIVGPQVKTLRKEKSWTQRQLADACKECGYKISRVTIAKIERQLCGVDEKQLFVLTIVLGKPFDSLLPKNAEKRLRAGEFEKKVEVDVSQLRPLEEL